MIARDKINFGQATDNAILTNIVLATAPPILSHNNLGVRSKTVLVHNSTVDVDALSVTNVVLWLYLNHVLLTQSLTQRQIRPPPLSQKGAC